MATKENKAFLENKYKNLGDGFIYKQVPQGELSNAKDAKDKKAGYEGEEFDIEQKFSDVPINGVDAAKIKGAGKKPDEYKKLWDLADDRNYMVNAAKEANAGK